LQIGINWSKMLDVLLVVHMRVKGLERLHATLANGTCGGFLQKPPRRGGGS
jgi:hypothetical protein